MYYDDTFDEPEDESVAWIALADMMTGLMAIFLALAIAVLVMQKSKRDAIVLTLSEKLEQSLIESGVNSKIENGRLIVSNETNFKSGSAALSDEGRHYYATVMPIYAKAIFELPPEQQRVIDHIVVEGYTDKVGSYASNMTLSTARANAILTFVDSLPEFNYKAQLLHKLTASGRGESDATGSEELGNPSDRKVIIRFEFNDYTQMPLVKSSIEDGIAQTDISKEKP